MKLLLKIVLIAQILVTPLLASKVLFVQDFKNHTNDDKYKSTGNALADMIVSDLVGLQPPFPRPPVRPNGSFRGLPQKANS